MKWEGHSLTEGMGGVPTRTLKNGMLIGFGAGLVFSVVEYFLRLPPLGPWLTDPGDGGIVGLLHLVLYFLVVDAFLWGGQVALWARGEQTMERFEPQLISAIRTLEGLGFTMALVAPALDAVKDRLSHFTDQERENLKLMLYFLAEEQLGKYEKRLASMNTAALREYVAGKRADASKAKAPKPEL